MTFSKSINQLCIFLGYIESPPQILAGSPFGKMKRLEHDQAKSGFTVFILSLAAIVSETTTEVVHKALETRHRKSMNGVKIILADPFRQKGCKSIIG